MPKQIKVGLITNEDGPHLGAYFSSLSQAEEVGSVVLSDPSGRHAAGARKALGEKLTGVFQDRQKMLADEKPEMALVTLEAALSPPAIDVALDADCHVFAEKPACVSLDDFVRVKKKADEKKRYLMLALANRLAPPLQEAKKLITEGAIGDVYGLEMHLIADQTRLTRPDYQKSWFADKKRAGGGHLIWLGIHWLDLAMYLTGSKIERVNGFSGLVGAQPIQVEDSAALAMRFENGTFGTLTSGYYLDRGYHQHIKIWGSHGWLHFEPRNEVPLRWYSSRDEKKARVVEYQGPKGPSGYPPFVQAAVRACAGLQDPPISNDDSLYVLQTVFASYKAAETGQTQQIVKS